jgi:alanine dehydrogenase
VHGIEDDRVTVLLDDATIQSVFDWRLAIAALREAYAAPDDPARFPPRSIARSNGSWLRTLSGAPGDSGFMGVKVIAAALGVRRASYLIALFDQNSAELVALLDGNSITGYRTAATSALAADLLAVPGPLTVAALGSGFEAMKHVRALAAVRDLASVRVYSPRPESRARFAAAFADLPAPVLPADSPELAVANASLIICAARSYDETPVFLGEWLAEGITVVSIGSTVPEQREVDPATFARADTVIADLPEEILYDTGDLIAARDAGVEVGGKIASLADMVSGRHPGRTSERQIIVYKSVGSALQDLAVAGACVTVAGQRGLGTVMTSVIEPAQK